LGLKEHNWSRALTPNQLVAVLLALWWALNVIAGALLELANDEAYYWFYSWHLDWGYYDHPPMVALLVKLGTLLLGGELGVRLFFILLQPLYLYLFWTLIRPPQATRRDAVVYCLVCFAMPMLQLYGLLALPDAPLLFFTVVFLWTYKRFTERDSWLNALLMGAAMALLMYSKYHGLLVIVFVLCSRWRNFRSPKLYAAVLLGILLYVPHLWWQYSHDFPSLHYHLVKRHDDDFTLKHLGDTLLNLLLVFNPLYLVHYGRGLSRQIKERRNAAYTWLLLGIIIFFTLSAFRYSTQPQWMLPAVFGFIVLLMDEARRSDRAYRYIRTVAIVTGVLFLLARLVILVLPLPGQLWNNRAANAEIARLADGRPVVFMHNYTASAKYTFYTGQPAYTLPIYYMRQSQWQYCDLDESFTGKDVVIALSERPANADNAIHLSSDNLFWYREVSDFRPLRKVEIIPEQPLQRVDGDSVDVVLHLYNPYPYPICSTDNERLSVALTFRIEQRIQPCTYVRLTDTLPPHDTLTLHPRFALPKNLEPGKEYSYAFLLRTPNYPPCDNSPRYKFKR